MTLRTQAGMLLAAGLLALGCARTWSDEDRQSFLDDCLGNIRLDDEGLRSMICACWLERTAEKYSLEEVNGGDRQIAADFVEIGKQCSAEHGVRAYLPGEE